MAGSYVFWVKKRAFGDIEGTNRIKIGKIYLEDENCFVGKLFESCFKKKPEVKIQCHLVK